MNDKKIQINKETGFYTVNGKTIEGFIGENNETDILFILREPNDKNVFNSKCFWFKDHVVNGTAGLKYLRTYGRFAVNLCKKSSIPDDTDNDNHFKAALKHCTYINLYPFAGEGSKSAQFKNTLKLFTNNKAKLSDEKCHYKEYSDLIKNRKYIIDSFIFNKNCKYIITTYDIFNALIQVYAADEEILMTSNNKKFRYFKINNTVIYEFYHPAARFKYEIIKELFQKDGTA